MKKGETIMMVEDYLRSRRINLKQYSYSIVSNIINKHFLNYFINDDLNELKPIDINNYYLSIAELKLKAKTKNNIISTVMVMMNWFDLMEYIDSSIYKKFKQILKPFPLIEPINNDYLTIKEIKKMISLIDVNNKEDYNEKIMLEILAFTGIRKSELRALKFSDINFKTHSLSINKQLQTINTNGRIEEVLVEYTKTNKNRLVYLPKWLCEDLNNYKKEFNINRNELIIKYKVVRINRILNKHLKNANIRHVKVHDLRHSYCTMLYENGADSKFVQKQLGHSSERTSRDIYEHLTNKMRIKGIKIINRL